MDKNIVVLDAKAITRGDMSLKDLEEFGTLTLYDVTKKEEVAERIENANYILCSKTILDSENMKNARKLEYIGVVATGYNNIDISFAKSRNITVCNAGGYSTYAVAQHTFALILEHFNQVNHYYAFVKQGGWKESEVFSPFLYPMQELYAKTIGIIGCGSIGRQVATIAKAFGMKVLVYARHKTEVEGGTFTGLEELLGKSDVVSVHCPLNDESYHLFNQKTFSMYKDGAFFVNTARGPIVEEKALIDALRKGKLAGAAIDVLEQEPMSESCKMLEAPNLIITPHVAWAPIETRARLMDIVKENLRQYLKGYPINVIN